MTHIQELFIKNLRFYRKKKNFTQLAFSERIDLSPNYLNAVENGKNFPSPEVLQKIADGLEILPYELFLENVSDDKKRFDTQLSNKIIQDLKSQICLVFDNYRK